MNEVLFKVILGLIPVLATVLTGFIIPLILTKLGAEKLAVITKWTTYAVNAAEMLFATSGSGELKKKYVIDFINNLINKKKVVITEEQIEILIESAVSELNNLKVK